jgi:hypothetical protein
MNVVGLSTSTFSPSIVPSKVSDWNRARGADRFIGLEPRARRRQIVAADDFVRRLEPDIVAIVAVFRPGVTEPDQQTHAKELRWRDP